MAGNDLKLTLSTAESKPDAGDHPTADELVAYRYGELEDLASARLRGHLAACPSCTRILLDLGGGARSGDSVLDDAWRKFQDRLESESPDTLASPADAALASIPRPKHSSWLAQLATAVILLLLIGAITLLQVQHRKVHQIETRLAEALTEIEVFRTPRLAVPNHTLLPIGFLRDGQEPHVGAPTEAPFLILTLAGAAPQAFDRYRLVVVDASDAVIWQGDGLARDDRGYFTVVLPSDLLSTDELELQVVGVDAEDGSTAETVIARYRLDPRQSTE